MLVLVVGGGSCTEVKKCEQIDMLLLIGGGRGGRSSTQIKKCEQIVMVVLVPERGEGGLHNFEVRKCD